ncbi:MAG TPA: 16S rRNA (cytosine(967)-C(5))-methyltransferase RsmB [Candidatus Acidoferrales bacterium]|nr:16S rRNA (cytosine(967)-C(5))-methyltransferase RsmB [Candidatus Acidoferrales bacterium]
MPLSPARKFAFEILLRVETEGAFASDLLHSRLVADTTARDAALATELVMGVLRWRRELDFFIERYTNKKTSALDAEVLISLRLGIYQLRRLARIPEHAAVSESVELVKRSRKKSAVALVNAVLRRAAREKTEPLDAFLHSGLASADRLSITLSHPSWLVERWLARFGESKTLALLESNNAPPSAACALLDPTSREQLVRSLEAAGVKTAPGRLAKNSLILAGGNVQKTQPFQNGSLSFQDEASQLIPLLLDVRPGDSALDLCAAPGGKTITLARAAGPTSLYVAADLHEHRLRLLRDRLMSAPANKINLVALDGTAPLPFRHKFDRILVDAPCSGTGTLARNPEIRWRLKPADFSDFHQRQVSLLSSALDGLASRGRLIYSTCSLEPEENEQVLSEALASHPESRVVPAHLPPDALVSGVALSQLVGSDGFFRTFPPDHRTDGFFAAAIENA